MLQAILDNHLLLWIIVLLFLLLVPALFIRSRGLRDPSRPERRSHGRSGGDRRA